MFNTHVLILKYKEDNVLDINYQEIAQAFLQNIRRVSLSPICTKALSNLQLLLVYVVRVSMVAKITDVRGWGY